MNKGIGGRIVGGTDARRGEFPWQISYQFTFGNAGFHSCGGSILKENKIGKIFQLALTAYHSFGLILSILFLCSYCSTLLRWYWY